MSTVVKGLIPSTEWREFPAIGYTNRGFINENFLKSFQRDNSTQWHRIEEPAVNLAFRDLCRIYADAKSSLQKGRHENGELDPDLIIPVLQKVLGFNRRKKKFTPPGTTDLIEPDHLLFSSAALSDRFMADSGQLKRDLKTIVAQCESKGWNKNLDARESSRTTSPVEQLLRDMRHTGSQYGILTNGHDWRIYTKDALENPGVYFEIHLPVICETEDESLFELFYNMFSLAAVHSDSAAPSHLEKIRSHAAAFGRELERNLRVRMYTAIEFLTNGFRDSDPEQDLEDHYQRAMLMMYRVLFILKAEDSNLLPIRDTERYFPFSLRKLCEESESMIADWEIGKRDADREKTNIFASIKALSKAFDSGNTEVGITTGFNGGLFSDILNPKVLKTPISNYYLAHALVRCCLAKNPHSQKYERVDFSSINYQHLGSVYEGLLQYEPTVATESLVTIASSLEFQAIKKKSSVPAGFERVRDVSKGEVHLKLKEEARKNSGSYYTPQWVVNASLEMGGLISKIDSANTLSDLLSISVCDPAMGSGHFLVEVARRFIERGRIITNENEFVTFNDVAEKIVKKCIYGVDKNPLATMLAKVNIWFLLASRDRKLPNLDSNLKFGNSLCFNPDAKKKVGDCWFDWTEQFDTVFDETGGFTYVVGNPPWGGNISEEKARISIYFPDVKPDNLNSFDLFIRQSMRLLAAKGKVIFVLPRNLIKAHDYQELRKHVASNVCAVADLGAAFDGVTQEAVTLVLSEDVSSNVTVYPRYKGIEAGDKLFAQSHSLPNSTFVDHDAFNIYWTPQMQTIVTKMLGAKEDILGNLVTQSRGIEYGGNGEVAKCPSCKKYITLPKKKKKSDKDCPHCAKNVTLDELQPYYMISKTQTAKHRIPIVSGRDIGIFGIKTARFLEPKLPGINYKPKLFKDSEPAVFITKICDSLKCAFADEGEYATQGVYVLKQKTAESNLAWIASVLNSEVFAFFHEFSVNLGAKLTTNILLDDLLGFPIPTAPTGVALKTVEKSIATIKKSGVDSTAGSVAKDRIDTTVADAYKLTAKELSTVRSFMAEIKELKAFVDVQVRTAGTDAPSKVESEDEDEAA